MTRVADIHAGIARELRDLQCGVGDLCGNNNGCPCWGRIFEALEKAYRKGERDGERRTGEYDRWLRDKWVYDEMQRAKKFEHGREKLEWSGFKFGDPAKLKLNDVL